MSIAIRNRARTAVQRISGAWAQGARTGQRLDSSRASVNVVRAEDRPRWLGEQSGCHRYEQRR
jgi:hypothetical protein